MAINVGSLLVSLGLDSAEFKTGLTNAEKQFRRSTKRIEGIGKSLTNVGRNLSLAVTAPLAALGVASFKAASDAAELESAFNQTFGSMAKDVQAWAVTTGDAMGRSTQEIQNAANTFGIFFNQAAPTKQAAADLAKQFAILAQDLSSFYNTSPDEALQKLRSGLSGESEPLRDFGVFLNEAAVGQKALQLGLAKTTKELTDQQKIMARAALIMEATTTAQGDVARTADGTANRIRAAKAAFEELQVAIGQKLIPALTPLIQRVTELLNGFNKLSPGVQTAIVTVGGLAAALGPVSIVVGGITKLLAPFVAGIRLATTTAAAAGVQITTLGTALAVLRASIVTLTATIAPYAAALGGVALIYYALKLRAGEAVEVTEKYRKAQEAANDTNARAKDLLGQVATATGKLRQEIIAKAKADRQAAIQALAKAKADLVALRAETARLRAYQGASKGGLGAADPRFASLMPDAGAGKAIAQNNKNAAALEQTLADNVAAISQLTKVINSTAPAPVVSSSDTKSGSGSTRSKASGPSKADIEARFQDELDGFRARLASALQQNATNAEDRANESLKQVELERRITLRSIAADEDYSAAQKERLTGLVELIADQERAAVETARQAELEREAADLAGVEFDRKRELLGFQADLADTQAERKRVALQILALEQEYRRSQLEMVVASKTASDAEKKRAQAILDSLGAIEAGETASAKRANETDVERYLRELNKSPEQISEEIDRIKIKGLENLNDALVDAIVNFRSLKDVASGGIKSVIADLLRLQTQQAIIKPLAGALGLSVPGFANGTIFAPGGLALVGERGPELVNLPRGSRVHTASETARMMEGRGGDVYMTVNTPNADSFRRSERQITSSLRRRLTPA